MEQIPFVSKGVSSFHVPSSALYNMNVQHLLQEFLCNINNDTTIYHMIFNLCVCSVDWVQHVYHTEEVRLFLAAFYKFIWGETAIFHFIPATNVKTTANTIQFCVHKSISLSLASLPALSPLLDFPCLYASDMLLKAQIDFILEKSSFDCVCSLQDCMLNWMTWVCKFLVGSSSNFSLSSSSFLKKISIGWAIIKENLYLWRYWKSSMKPLADESLNTLKIGNMQQQNFIKSWQKVNHYGIKS